MVNNLRDIPTDAVAGKRTLAVRLGADRTRALYLLLVVAAAAAVVAVAVATTWWALVGLGFLAFAAPAVAHRPGRRLGTDAGPGPPADRARRARLGGAGRGRPHAQRLTAARRRRRRRLAACWTLLIIVAIVVAAIVVWRMRVPLMAKVLGQSESRVNRQLNRRKPAS